MRVKMLTVNIKKGLIHYRSADAHARPNHYHYYYYSYYPRSKESCVHLDYRHSKGVIRLVVGIVF